MRMKYGGKKTIICVLVIGALLMNNFIVLQSIYSNQGGHASDATYSSYEIEPVQYSFTPPVDGDIWYFSEEKKEGVFEGIMQLFNLAVGDSFYSLGTARLVFDYTLNPYFWIVNCKIGDTNYFIGLDLEGKIDFAYPYKGDSYDITPQKANQIYANNFNTDISNPKLIRLGTSYFWAYMTNNDPENPNPLLIQASTGDIQYMSSMFNSSTDSFTMGAPSSTRIGTENNPVVPLYDQGTTSWCGPYSACMIMGHWGYPFELSGGASFHRKAEDLAALSQGGPANSSIGVYIGPLAEAVSAEEAFNVWHGDMKSIFDSDYSDEMIDENGVFRPNDLKACLYRGWPVLTQVMLDTSLPKDLGAKVYETLDIPLHAIAVTGFDDTYIYQGKTGYVSINDPSGSFYFWGNEDPDAITAIGDAMISYDRFEEAWSHFNSCGGVWDSDIPTIESPPPEEHRHQHKNAGLVMYRGDGRTLMKHPELKASLGQVPEIIEKNTPFIVDFSIENKNGINNKDIGPSGVEIIVTNGVIELIDGSAFCGQSFNLDGTESPTPSEVIRLTIDELKTGDIAQGSVEIKAYDNPLTIKYRGYGTNTDEFVHDNYDFTLQNPWDEKRDTIKLYDNRIYNEGEEQCVYVPKTKYLVVTDPPTPLTNRENIITKPCHPPHQITVLDDIPEIIVNTPTFSPAPDWDGWYRTDPGDITVDVDFRKRGVSQLANAKFKLVQFDGSSDWNDIFTTPCDEFTEDWVIPRSLLLNSYGYIEIWVYTTSGASEYEMVELKVNFDPPSGPIWKGSGHRTP